MDTSIGVQLRQLFAKRAAILTLAAAMMLALCAGYALWVMPHYRAMQQAEERRAEAEKQWRSLAASPEAEQVSQAQIDALVRQVPTELLHNEVLKFIMNHMADKKVRIALFQQNKASDAGGASQSGADSELTDSVEASAATPSPQPSPSPSNAASAFQQLEYSLQFSGTFSDLINFMNDIAADKQIVYIRDWSIVQTDFTDQTDEDEDFKTAIAASSESASLSMTLVFPILPQFYEVFGGKAHAVTPFDDVMGNLIYNYPSIQYFNVPADGAEGDTP